MRNTSTMTHHNLQSDVIVRFIEALGEKGSDPLIERMIQLVQALRTRVAPSSMIPKV